MDCSRWFLSACPLSSHLDTLLNLDKIQAWRFMYKDQKWNDSLCRVVFNCFIYKNGVPFNHMVLLLLQAKHSGSGVVHNLNYSAYELISSVYNILLFIIWIALEINRCCRPFNLYDTVNHKWSNGFCWRLIGVC